MARISLLTATQKNTVQSWETVNIQPGVEHTQRVLQAIVLTLSFCFNNNYFLQDVVFISLASNLRAAGTTGRTTDTILAGGLVSDTAEEEAVELQQVVLGGPGESCAALGIKTDSLALVGVWYRVESVEDILRHPGYVRLETATTSLACSG